jgi:hypothetical protein
MAIAISDQAKEILRAAGWFEGRRIDISPIKQFLQEYGFSVFPTAVEFLGEFHGLKKLVLPKGGLSFVHFDVWEEMAYVEEDDKSYLFGLVAEPICPVGHGGGCLLFATASGALVYLNDQWFACGYIPSFREGMDFILGLRKDPRFQGIPLSNDKIPPEFRR